MSRIEKSDSIIQLPVAVHLHNATFASMKQGTLDISYSLDTIDNAAQKLWAFAKQHRIWTFSGDMGAGKTTLISSLCRHLGVQEAVSSPTFSLINEYHFHNPEGADTTILHMDWYRIGSITEAIDAGMEDALQGDAYCFIEWPEKAAALLQGEHIRITINTISEKERSLHTRLTG